MLTEAVAVARALADDIGLCSQLASLAEQELRLGDASNAARHQQEALHLVAELGTRLPIACAFILAARWWNWQDPSTPRHVCTAQPT
jgi:hypothetical protein